MEFSNCRKTRSQGVVLLLAMVFLLLLATLSGAAMQTSIAEFQMAANGQFREQAFQRAQAIVSAISSNEANFPLVVPVGSLLCKVGDSNVDCSATRHVVLDSAIEAAPPGVAVLYRVERMGPSLLPFLPIRMPQTAVSSTLAYNAAIYEAQVRVDGGDVNLGVAEVAQGIALLVASSTGESAE